MHLDLSQYLEKQDCCRKGSGESFVKGASPYKIKFCFVLHFVLYFSGNTLKIKLSIYLVVVELFAGNFDQIRKMKF